MLRRPGVHLRRGKSDDAAMVLRAMNLLLLLADGVDLAIGAMTCEQSPSVGS